MIVGIASCAQTSMEDVAKKIDSNEKLSEEEERVALEYSCNLMQVYTDSMLANADSPADLMNCIQDLNDKFPYSAQATNYLIYTERGNIAEKNLELYDRARKMYDKGIEILSSVINITDPYQDNDIYPDDIDAPLDSLMDYAAPVESNPYSTLN